MSKSGNTPPTLDAASTWLVSDTHFGHNNIVGFCHRPEDHETIMVENWARAVPEDGTVVHLGDLSYRANGMFKNVHAKHLTGRRKLLIRGNHDRQRHRFYRDSGFKLCPPLTFWYGRNGDDEGGDIIVDNPDPKHDTRVSLGHYPWSDEQEGRSLQPWDLRIHGHIHNNGYSRAGFVPFLAQHINLSIEQTKYTPVNLKLLLDGYLYGIAPSDLDEQEIARKRKAERMVEQTARAQRGY